MFGAKSSNFANILGFAPLRSSGDAGCHEVMLGLKNFPRPSAVERPLGRSSGGFAGWGVLCDKFGGLGRAHGNVGEVFGADVG